MEDESGEEEAAEEEVDGENVEDTERWLDYHFREHVKVDLQNQKKESNHKAMLRSKLERALLVLRLEVGGRGGRGRIRHGLGKSKRTQEQGIVKTLQNNRERKKTNGG